MSFTDVPPGCTHSSGAVHPVLSSPTSTRAHTPRCTSARLAHSQTRTTPSAVPTLPTAYSMRQEMVTFYLSFFLSSCAAATTNASSSFLFFFSDGESCFPLYLDYGEQNGLDKLNLRSSSLLLVILLHAHLSL